MVIIKIKGGLGNQMFQYGVAAILAKRNESQILVDTGFFQQDDNLNDLSRMFELDIFNNSYIEASQSDVIQFEKRSLWNKVKKKVGMNYPKVYKEQSFNYDPGLKSIKVPVFLKGYFQSYKYFYGNEKFVRDLFSFPQKDLGKLNEELLELIRSKHSISVHIRRGDYVHNKATQTFHGNCSLNYYKKAISLLAKEEKKIIVIFFSDDIQWVKRKFHFLKYPKVFVDHNRAEESWKDMLLMSSCNDNIIANSSFSWWAAWLNENPQKKIFAPLKWFADKKQENCAGDLIPPEWIRL